MIMTYILMVIFLKIILFKKKTFFIFSLVILFITLNFIYYSISSPSSITCNTSETLGLEDKIKNIYKKNEKIAYLTFDDGPSPSVTPKILDILKEENIKASFFVIGKKVKEHPEIVKRAYEEGHYIANHTYSHNNSFIYKDSKSFVSEIKNTDLAIGSAIGVDNYSSHTIVELTQGVKTLVENFDYVTARAQASSETFKGYVGDFSASAHIMEENCQK